MSPRRESRREHWDRFWSAQPVEEVYESVGAVHAELARHVDEDRQPASRQMAELPFDPLDLEHRSRAHGQAALLVIT